MAEPTTPTDEELNEFILFKLNMLGVDISVLPVDDPDAPITQNAVLSSCRSTLRNALTVLEYPLDPQYTLATYYASPQSAWTNPEPNSIT